MGFISGTAAAAILIPGIIIIFLIAGLVIWYYFWGNPMQGTSLIENPPLDPFPSSKDFQESFKNPPTTNN